MLSFLKRLRVETEDWLRYHPLVRAALSRWQNWRTSDARGAAPQAIARFATHLCAAARWADDPEREKYIQARIRAAVEQLDCRAVDWTEFVSDFRDARISKAAILKPCLGPHERGVLFISFEREWIKLLNLRDLADFARRYTLVIAPSSSPHNLVNYAFAQTFPEPIFTLISNPHDADVLPGVSPRLIVAPLYASCWVNPDLYRPLPRADRPYDLLMVASWGKVKRHHVLFSALRELPRELRVLLVGQDQEGRDAETIREVARWYGVADRFSILGNQPYSAVAEMFCQARSSIVLSKREGSCVVVTESMFADTPVAVLRGAELGSRVFINDETGCFLNEATLARDLGDFLRRADNYKPRAWAELHISCHRSTQVLNGILKEHALALGQTWTQDIASLQWSPDPKLANDADRYRLATERKSIVERYGLEIGPIEAGR